MLQPNAHRLRKSRPVRRQLPGAPSSDHEAGRGRSALAALELKPAPARVAAALVFLSLGCSGLADPEDTYDCLRRGICDSPDEDPLGRWSCLAGAAPPRPTAEGAVDYVLPIVDYTSQNPADELRIQRCSKPDSSCMTGEPVPIAAPGTSSDGVLVQLERSFGRNNYLKVTSASVVGMVPLDVDGDGVTPDPDVYIPYAYYFGDTVYESRRVAPNFQLLRFSDVARLARDASLSLNPARALLIVRAYDCNDDPAPGVQFRIAHAGDDMGDPPQPYTVYGGLPIPPPSLDEFLPTDEDGQGGFANVPFGTVQVFARVGDRVIGPTVGVSATAVAGQITAVEVHARLYGMPPLDE